MNRPVETQADPHTTAAASASRNHRWSVRRSNHAVRTTTTASTPTVIHSPVAASGSKPAPSRAEAMLAQVATQTHPR